MEQSENINKNNNEKNSQVNSSKKIQNPAMIAGLGIFVGIIIAFLAFFFWQAYSEKQGEFESLKQELENLKKESSDSTGKGIVEEDVSGENTTGGEEYAGWKTYYNYEIGYMLRYPSNWILTETDEWNEITDQAVKYVSIDTPDKKFFFYFGLKSKGDDFGISNRTGVGAGELADGEKMTVLGTPINIKKLVYKGKIQEFFFGALGFVNTKDGKYTFSSSLSPRGTTTGNFPDLEIAQKILTSVRIIEKKKVSCDSILNSNDKESMKNWKNYSSNKYGYSFKYPKDWTNPDVSGGVVTLNGDGGDTTFQFRSGPSTAIDYMGYKVDSNKNIKISCQGAKSTYLSGDPVNNPGSDNDRMIFSQFEKNGAPHLVMFSYQHSGASISGDMQELYDLIIKSIEFE